MYDFVWWNTVMDLSFWTYLGIACSLLNVLIDFDRENYSWSLFWVVWAILLGVNNLNGYNPY